MEIGKTYEGNKVPKVTKYLYPAGTIARDAAYTLVSLFFLTYIQFAAPLGYISSLGDTRSEGVYTAQMLVISIIMIFCRIWDGFNDPIMARIIEKCHFKTGKYKPWILIGGLTNSVVLFLMFYLQPAGWRYVLAFLAFYLLRDMTFTMNDIGYRSMLPSLSSDAKERNTLTTLVSIGASIGGFAAGGIIPLLVAGNAKEMYALVAGIIAILFAITQTILYFFVREKKRDALQETVSEDTKFTDMFRILKTNSQVRVTVITMLIYYLASAILNAFGLNYFYFTYGYEQGGNIQFYFTVAYALGSIIAQISFPFLINKFTRGQLFRFTFIGIVIGYFLFFFYDLPFNDAMLSLYKGNRLGTIGDIVVMCFIGAVIFSMQGLFYLVLLIMMTNSIEYNERKDEERRESLIFAFRPLDAKISSALQTGILYLGLLLGGLYAISNKINNIELERGNAMGAFAVNQIVDATFASSNNIAIGTTVGNLGNDQLTAYAQWLAEQAISGIEPRQFIVMKLFMTVIPMILVIVAFILIKKKYFIDEKVYNQMVLEIDARRANGDKEVATIPGDIALHNVLIEHKSKEAVCKPTKEVN
jgi:melibiose permease/lactose/raffinose/galactose permease